MHLQIYTFAYSYFSEDNTFFKKSLFDFIFSKKSQQDKSVLILQVKRAFTFWPHVIHYRKKSPNASCQLM